MLLGVSAPVAPAYSCPNAALRTGASAGLADCRAYEQVSPVDKGGFSAYPTQATTAQSSPTGEGLGWLSYQAFPGAQGNSALYSAHVSTRTAGGWRSSDVTPAVPKAEAMSIYLLSYAFSEDLSQTLIQMPLVALTPEATPGVYNLFLRRPDGSYSWVNSARPAVSAEAQCPGELSPVCFFFADVSAFAGASGDFTHILFESNAQLTAQAPETGIESLYESVGGQVLLVGYLPDGQPAAGSTAGAGSSIENFNGEVDKDGRVEHAISRDGSRVVFQARADGGEPDAAQSGITEVYDRIEGRETVELSAPAPGAAPAVGTAEPATFWAASDDGSRVFFTSAAELTTRSNTGSANGGDDLYEYNLDTRALSDLSVDTNPLDASTGAAVQGVVDASADGAYVYFVATGQLDPGKGVDGQPNLYMVHDGGGPVFIATLSGTGSCAFRNRSSADSCDWTPYQPELEAYLTPDGRHLAFMSSMSIPSANFPAGYANTDPQTGEADSEVYEYSAPSAQEEEHGEPGVLLCASCDPSGAPPVGNALIGGITQTGAAEPGLQPYNGISTPFHHVSALSDDGALLFYTAPAPLAGPGDRVYEYEQAGHGGCAGPGGCQFPISSRGGEADEFLGAGADGRDVFFATTSRLSPADVDNLRDVYDARAGGGIPAPAGEAACQGQCRQPGAGAPGAPALASGFAGPSGNLAPPSATATAPKKRVAKRVVRCAKGRKLSHGRCVKARRRAKAKRARRGAAG